MDQPHKCRFWTVDYGNGDKPAEIVVPHAWNQELSIEHEGPVTYKTIVENPTQGGFLLFNGVSYHAMVYFNSKLVKEHRGMWDKFSIPLPPGEPYISVEVIVTKAGGERFPCTRSLVGNLPIVHQTFGGIFKDVEVVPGINDPISLPLSVGLPKYRNDSYHFQDGDKQIFLRGITHQGWYPKFGHQNPDGDTIIKEINDLNSLGFNAIKFSGWMPPHDYLTSMEAKGMMAWLEIPILPINTLFLSQDDSLLHDYLEEAAVIIRQYRHHKNIICWSGAPNLGEGANLEFRRKLFQLLHSLSGCAFVRDDSESGESLVRVQDEYSTFDCFPSHADLPYLDIFLNLLRQEVRKDIPIIICGYGACSTHRDTAKLLDERPHWASAITEYNSPGIRQGSELAPILLTSRFAQEPRINCHELLIKNSREKSLFFIKYSLEALYRKGGMSGYFLSSLRDTPVKTTGLYDDWGILKYDKADLKQVIGSEIVFLIPRRVIGDLEGEIRPGNDDPLNVFVGKQIFSIGAFLDSESYTGGTWHLLYDQKQVASGAFPPVHLQPLTASAISRIEANFDNEGEYELRVEFGHAKNSWIVHAYQQIQKSEVTTNVWVSPESYYLVKDFIGFGFDFMIWDGKELPTSGILILTSQGTTPLNFWGNTILEYPTTLFQDIDLENKYERLFPLTPQGAISNSWLGIVSFGKEVEVHLNSIDSETYSESPLLVQIDKALFVTTLRPFGGIGTLQEGIQYSPSGIQLLRDLASKLNSSD